MMFKFIAGLLLLVGVGSAHTEEIIIEKSNLVFPVAAQHMAELATAKIKSYVRYQDDVKRFGSVLFQTAYVASIIGDDGLKYIFVGFPMKKRIEGTYMSVIQYCEKLDSYEFERYGHRSEDVEELYQQFIDANNKSISKLGDACEPQDQWGQTRLIFD